MCQVKSMSISIIKGFNILLQGDMDKLSDDTYKTKYKRKPSALKILTKLHAKRY